MILVVLPDQKKGNEKDLTLDDFSSSTRPKKRK